MSRCKARLTREEEITFALMQCQPECEGLIISLAFKLFILLLGAWACFFRVPKASLPRIFMFRYFFFLLVPLAKGLVILFGKLVHAKKFTPTLPSKISQSPRPVPRICADIQLLAVLRRSHHSRSLSRLPQNRIVRGEPRRRAAIRPLPRRHPAGNPPSLAQVYR